MLKISKKIIIAAMLLLGAFVYEAQPAARTGNFFTRLAATRMLQAGGLFASGAVIKKEVDKATETSQESVAAPAYRPLISNYLKPWYKQYGVNPFYVLRKENEPETRIVMDEFLIRDYRAGDVDKNPYFRPERGFYPIVPTLYDSSPIHPFIQHLVQQHNAATLSSYVAQRHNPFSRAFYANAETIAQQNKGMLQRFYENFKQEKSSAHYFLGFLQTVHPQEIAPSPIKSAIQDTMRKKSSLERTNIFVESTITLQDLQTHVNPHITQEGEEYHLNKIT